MDKIDDWILLQENKRKGCFNSSYRHFDRKVTAKDYIEKGSLRNDLLSTTDLTKHKFWPLIRRDNTRRRFTKDIQNRLTIKQKNRPLMYLSHRDTCIVSYYAFLLKQNYENIIAKEKISPSVIAYRKIPGDNGHNKNNIIFAKEVFLKLQTIDTPSVILCLDIHGFFDHINHLVLRQELQQFCSAIPEQNFKQIFKIITKYHYVFAKDVETLFEKMQESDKNLGDWPKNSVEYNKYIVRENIIHKNKHNYGIPQGTPISDIFSNIYLYNFDKDVFHELEKISKDPFYRRYCDDIIFIIPREDAKQFYEFVKQRIKQLRLKISENKTEAFLLDNKKGIFKDITNKYVKEYAKDRHLLQYLGIRMNPITNEILLRESTVAKCKRKVNHISKMQNSRKNKHKKPANGRTKRQPMGRYIINAGKAFKSETLTVQSKTIRKNAKKKLSKN